MTIVLFINKLGASLEVWLLNLLFMFDEKIARNADGKQN